jgi:integrase
VGKGSDGRWIRQLRGGFHTRAEAERALLELRSSIDSGTYVESSDVTLGAYLRNDWLPATAPPRVKFDTWKDRRENLEAYVIPRIGEVALQDLNAAHLNRMYGELLRSGRTRGTGGLSPTSVRRLHSILRKAFNDGIRWGLLQRNPAVLADPPPMKVVQAARRRGMRTWTEAELRCFLESTKVHYLYPVWLFGASTGLRRSELLGLRWTDLNLKRATATVRQTVTQGEDGYRPEEEQKSALSARTVHIDQRVVEVLLQHRTDQVRARALLGDGWQDNDLVFPRADGNWWNPPSVTAAFTRAVAAAGVPRIRLHDLRHTHASLLLVAGVSPKVVSERLGHSSVAFTLDTYAHVMPGMQPDAAKLFMDLVLGEVDPPAGEPNGEQSDEREDDA